MNGQFEIGAITPFRYFFGIAIVLGLLFAMVAPESGHEWDGLRRLFQWQLQSLGPVILLVMSHLLLHRLPGFDGLNSWLKLVCSGLIGAVLFSPLALSLDVWFEETSIMQGQWLSAMQEELIEVTPPVVIAWLAINAPWLLGFRLVKHNTPDAASEPIAEAVSREAETGLTDAPLFYRLLPEAVRAELIYLKAELHYLKVVTVKGKALILYNLKDAIRELPSNHGFQSHRSYWVAKHFIRDVQKNGRQGQLTLKNGHTVPVSRRNMEKVATIVSDLGL